jgi:hypothetical protein
MVTAVMQSSKKNGLIFPVPHSNLLKYSQQWAIQFTHTLPALGWSALIPFQIYPTAKRLKYHKQLGYVFVFLAVLMMVGLCIIDQRGLVFTHFDFPNIAEVCSVIFSEKRYLMYFKQLLLFYVFVTGRSYINNGFGFHFPRMADADHWCVVFDEPRHRNLLCHPETICITPPVHLPSYCIW